MNIFVSYTRRDGVLTVDDLIKVNNHLSLKNNVFIHALKNIEEKVEQEEVIDNLLSSDVVLLLYTEGCLTSPWVNLEITLSNFLNIPIVAVDAKKIINNK